MSHKPNAVPVLQEGTVYTIILDNGRKVHDVIYHACVASGKSYFAKGDKTYPAEKGAEPFNHRTCRIGRL